MKNIATFEPCAGGLGLELSFLSAHLVGVRVRLRARARARVRLRFLLERPRNEHEAGDA